jgi:DNA uptake protein ComE-like DNA-binding protein
MKLNLLYSPSQRRGIFFLLILFTLYFIFLFFKRNSEENISPFVIIESEVFKTLEVENQIIIPENRNPNFWITKDWVKLGFSSSQIKIIQNYKKKLNVFSNKPQLLKCYAFNESERKMLDSIVVIKIKSNRVDIRKSFTFLLSSKSPNYDLKNYFDTLYFEKNSKGIFNYYVSTSKRNNLLATKNCLKGKDLNIYSLDPKTLRRIVAKTQKINRIERIKKSKFVVNINLADSLQWRKLRGIGVKRSIHILNYKNSLGGFINLSQVNEVYSINDSLFNSIKIFLRIKDSSVVKININTCSIKQLKNHPYIKWNIANSIVNYRVQHGDFQLIEDLKKIRILNNTLYYKIVPYLTIF